MSKKENHIDDYLLGKWFSGNANAEERSKVKDWAAISEENQQVLHDSENVIEKINQLQLMESISSVNALNKVKQRIGKTEKISARILSYWQKIAVILVLPLLAYSLYQFFNADQKLYDNQLSWIEISTPVGLRSVFDLPDGTRVWLNGNTQLKYPAQFNPKERLVKLEGEAFFEVVSNAEIPFVVDAGEIHVKAVGTSFNVLAYPNDDKLETALVEGKVILFKQGKGGMEKMTVMEPGQLSIYNPSSHQNQLFKDANLDKNLAWREGKIQFRNDPLEEVLRKLGQWFNVDFCISKNVGKEYKYTGSFQSEGLRQILEYIELTTPITFVFPKPEQAQDSTYAKQSISVIMKP